MTTKKIGLATFPFFSSFKTMIPSLEIVTGDINNYDLIIFSGGEDINPNIYGEGITTSWGINNRRDNIELNILEKCLKNNIYILGVCRGHQLINAALGGKIIQDIAPHHYEHDLEWRVDAEELIEMFPKVNSMHHQGYTEDKISNLLTSIAVEPKTKIVELAVGKGILTTQFHPEFMRHRDFFNFITNKARLYKENYESI